MTSERRHNPLIICIWSTYGLYECIRFWHFYSRDRFNIEFMLRMHFSLFIEYCQMLNTTLISETDFLFLAIACVIVRKLSGMANYPTARR